MSSNNRVVITGAGGGSPNRLEINVLVKNDKFFSLYVQALQLMYNTNQDAARSFFQVGGIHGLPYIPWDGAIGNPPFNPNAQWGGYCTHGSVLFPTWHRPYIMLYEQILQQHARTIAARYTVDQAAWKKAAEDLRQPYWDWAANSVPPAEVISLTQVTITTFNGQRVSVDNPLYRYRFHPIDPRFPRPYSGWPTTLRQPTSTRPDATDNIPRLRNILRAAQNDIRSSTYSMLTRVRTWTAFSNHTVGDGGSSSNSIEAIHDGIHVNVGGMGQMGNPAVAAFDPIFFLHHCNVDRMLSLWAALNPGVWVSRGDSEDGTFTLRAEVPVDRTTALTPFWNTNSTFWASTGTTDTTKLGYSYPEFNGLDMGNPQAVRVAIGNIVNRLYGSSIFGSSAPTSAPTTSFLAASPAAAAVPVEKERSAPAQGQAVNPPPAAVPQAQSVLAAGGHGHGSHPTAHPSHAHPSHAQPSHYVPPNQGLWDWTTRIEFKKYELGVSFSVLLFLSAVPEDPNEWQVCENLVGAHYAFVNTAAGECENCRTQGNLVEEGFVHLNQAIAQHSGLGSLEPAVVEPYLTKQLRWKVQKLDGSVAELQNLEVSVIGTPLSYPPGAQFPVPGERHRYNRITYGRPGGSRQA
jgi:tyrosinase